eukprot:CAMPEP_0202970384 /NCGR_PEP_ID=MMETSP1396-20130829/16338_1 /ASSEMBLY_ACC=CAM_ASM_000872 /TAXON_ID= /ORGANISM="Pseudokeronopsis sp., Strain Brazil" /LENGTH=155 /DNA_ID=CAMNT_0049698841 /DNA_START=91 /DNA_END=558 /DNA_ORIENTATION=+
MSPKFILSEKSLRAGSLKSAFQYFSASLKEMASPVWSKCSVDESSYFQVDLRQTKSVPATFTKGDTVSLELHGAAFKQMKVEEIRIYVKVAGVPFYHESHSIEKDLDFGFPFEYSISWPIPSYAPSGEFATEIQVISKIKGKEATVGCAEVVFKL